MSNTGRSPQRVLLLVDDEANILRALSRLFRTEGYTVLTADSGAEGLELFESHAIGVVLSDQRMPHMTGAQFLERAREIQPQTMRIMLSGYTDLETVTDAINRGAIFKFLTKPWDDELLRSHVREAFEQYELRAERDRLAEELKAANEALAMRVERQSRDMELQADMMDLTRSILDCVPVGVLAIDEQGVIVMANGGATALYGDRLNTLLGSRIESLHPECLLSDCPGSAGDARACHMAALHSRHTVHCATLHVGGTCRGRIVSFIPSCQSAQGSLPK